MSRLTQTIILVVAMLLTGSFNTLCLKWEFQTCVPSISPWPEDMLDSGEGCPPGERKFNKPWLNNWLMFWAELSLLPVYFIGRTVSARKRRKVGKRPREPDRTSVYLFAIPGCCDVLGSGLGAVGLMHLPAAVWQMMRGALILFTSFLTVVFLKKRLMPYHYVSLTIITAGLFSIGYAAVQDTSTQVVGVPFSPRQTMIGIGFTLGAQFIAAFQVTFEEYLLQGKKVSAKRTVGMEGFWGVIAQGILLVAFTYIPGDDQGVIERLPDTVAMYTRPGNRTLLTLSCAYMVSIAAYNLLGLNVTKKISGVTRALIDSIRTATVWIVSLALWYSGDRVYGMPWTAHSPIQVAGFILLVVGTFLYNAILRIPGMNYQQYDAIPEGAWSPHVSKSKGMDDWEFSPPNSPQSPLLRNFEADIGNDPTFIMDGI